MFVNIKNVFCSQLTWTWNKEWTILSPITCPITHGALIWTKTSWETTSDSLSCSKEETFFTSFFFVFIFLFVSTLKPVPSPVSRRSGMLEQGVDRIVAQVVDPKINHIFRPEVEGVVREFLSPGSRSEELPVPPTPAEIKLDNSVPEQGTQHFLVVLPPLTNI